MKQFSILFFLAGFFFLSAVSYADIFSWTDGNGVSHFSNVPPRQTVHNLNKTDELAFDEAAYNERLRQQAEQEQERAAQIAEEKMSERATKVSKPTFKGTVEMFTTSRCGYCVRARNFFEQNHIRFKELNVDLSKEAARKFKEHNGRGVPLIFIGKERIVGFNEPAIREALGM